MSEKLLSQDSAGRQLLGLLTVDRSKPAVVIALAPGAVPVALPIAESLKLPLEVMVARALYSPMNHGTVLGAVARDGMILLDEEAVLTSGLSQAEIDELAANERAEMKRRVRLYRSEDDMIDVSGRTVLFVCDGTEPALVPLAAVKVLHRLEAGKVILLTPAITPDQRELFGFETETIISLREVEKLPTPDELYEEYILLTDDEIEPLIQQESPRAD